MAVRNFSSVAVATTLTAGINDSATAIAVASASGFPAAPFTLLLDADTGSEEFVLVTNVSGLNLTVTRGYDSTVAVAHSSGATVKHAVAGIDFREANTHVNATSGVHGITGSFVGTSDTQTLTNKTLSGSSNTFSNIPQSAVTDLTSDFSDVYTAISTDITSHANQTATHGASGSLVGTDNTQTLQNKSMSGTVNTFTNIPQSAVTDLEADIADAFSAAADVAADVAALPVCSRHYATRTTDYAVAAAATQTISWETGGGDYTSSGITIPTDGYYMVVLSVDWTPDAAGGRAAIRITVNGSTYKAVLLPTDDGNTNSMQVVATGNFTADQVVSGNGSAYGVSHDITGAVLEVMGPF